MFACFMSRTSFRPALALVVVSILGGCGRGNGLPTELMSHLADRGIMIVPSRVHAPLSSRGGYIVAPYDPRIVTAIVSAFKLERIEADNRQWRMAIGRTGGTAAPKELWGGEGRPSQFKLKSGGQFEYFYLLITDGGFMVLIAEYAYG